MNTKVVIALFCALAIASAVTAGGNVSCTTSCDDTNCGKGGSSTTNWSGTVPDCKITDCALLTANVSAKACQSCALTGTAANVYPNTALTACVAIDCAGKATAKTLIDSDCVTCNSAGYTAATDKGSCVAPSTSNGKVLAASAVVIAALLI